MTKEKDIPFRICPKCHIAHTPSLSCPDCGHVYPDGIFSVSGINITCFSEIEMEHIQWLWPERIALGKPTVISGKPGLGKSQLTALLAAHVTTGKNWPDTQNPCPIGSVIFLSAEDDPADTIKPRLIAAGADISLCHFLNAVKDEREDNQKVTRSFNLREDMARLETVISALKTVRLAVIDPISAYLGGVDSNNNADMRSVLEPLANMAARTKVAIILLTHENKSEKADPINRVIGSIGLVGAARAAYSVIKDHNTPEMRHFIPLKNNIGNDYDGFSYKIQTVNLNEGIRTSCIKWLPNLVKVKDILCPEGTSQTNGAQEFLKNILGHGALPASEVFEQGEGAGYSKSSLQRAKGRIGVKVRKDGMKGGWLWEIPNHQHSLSEYTEGIEDSTIEMTLPSPPS